MDKAAAAGRMSPHPHIVAEFSAGQANLQHHIASRMTIANRSSSVHLMMRK